MNAEKKVVSIITISILVVLLGTIIFSYCEDRFFGDTQEPATTRVSVDWEEIYPHKNDTANPPENSDTKQEAPPSLLTKIVKNYVNKVDYVKRLAKQYDSLSEGPKDFFRYVYGTTQFVLNHNVIEDPETRVYRLKNGYMTYKDSESVLDNTENVKREKEIVDYLEGQGISFLHFLVADTLVEEQGQLQPWMNDVYIEATEELISLLEQEDIDYLNAYDILKKSGKDYYSWFYKTDHHWTNECGLYLTKHISQKLNDEYDFQIDLSLYDEKCYEKTVYKDMFLGSYGKKTTSGYVKPEDFVVYTPTYETKFHLEVPNHSVDTTGDYSVLLDKRMLTYDYYHTNPYAAFMYGDMPVIYVENQLSDNEHHVLVIKRSKANVITPHLACGVKYLDIVDMRHFNGSINSFIEQRKPDLVLIIDSADNCDFSKWDIG